MVAKLYEICESPALIPTDNGQSDCSKGTYLAVCSGVVDYCEYIRLQKRTDRRCWFFFLLRKSVQRKYATKVIHRLRGE